MFGTNDVGLIPVDAYRGHMDDIIRLTIGQGIHPGDQHHPRPPRPY